MASMMAVLMEALSFLPLSGRSSTTLSTAPWRRMATSSDDMSGSLAAMNEFPHDFRRGGHGEFVRADLPQCVGERIENGGRGGRDAAFAATLDPQRIAAGRIFGQFDAQRRHAAGARHAACPVRGRPQRAAVA